MRHQKCWNGGAEEQIDIDSRVEWLLALDILGAGPLWRADEGKRRTRQPEAGGAILRKLSSHDSSGFDARHVFDEGMLGRSAAGSSEETELPCEHCDGQSHFLKRHRLYAFLYENCGARAVRRSRCRLMCCGCGSRGSSDHVHTPPKSNYRSRLCQRPWSGISHSCLLGALLVPAFPEAQSSTAYIRCSHT